MGRFETKYGEVVTGYDSELGYYAELLDEGGAVIEQATRAKSEEEAFALLVKKAGQRGRKAKRELLEEYTMWLLKAGVLDGYTGEELKGLIEEFLKPVKGKGWPK